MLEMGSTPEEIAGLSKIAERQLTPEITPTNAGNILALAFYEVKKSHTSNNVSVNEDNNDYGKLFDFTVHGQNGDIQLAFGTKDPLIEIGGYTLMLPPRPLAVARGLYIETGGKVKKVASRPKDVVLLLEKLQTQGVDIKVVAENLLRGIEEEYALSEGLRSEIKKLGLSPFTEEVDILEDTMQPGDLSLGEIEDPDQSMHNLAASESSERKSDEATLFGPLGKDAYSPDAQKRIEGAFKEDDRDDPTKEGFNPDIAEVRAKARAERDKMWKNREAEIERANELVAQGMDVLRAEREAIKSVSPLYEKQLGTGEGLVGHLHEASGFAEKFVLTPDGKSRFTELTDRQARLLARVITPSHDLQKFMAAPNGEDFTADHQMLAANFIREVYLANPNSTVDLGEPEGVVQLTQEDVDFIASVVGDHENILREEGRREFIHSSDAAERAKAMFFIIDVLTGVIEPKGDSGEFTINTEQLRTRFTDLYVRHMNLATRKVFRPQWGAYAIGDIVETLSTLESQGLKLPENTNATLIQAALDAFPLTKVEDPEEQQAVGQAYDQLKEMAFVEWETSLDHPPVIKGVIGGYEDAAFLAGPTADKGAWRERFLGLLGDVARQDPEYAHLEGDELLAKMREVTYNPVIVGRKWEASDAVNEALNAANDWVLLLHFPDEPELSDAQENKGTGSIVERGAFYANIILRGNVLVAAITDTTFNLDDNVQRARAKSFADIERKIPSQLKDRFIVKQTLEEAAEVVWEKLKEFKNQPAERQDVPLQLDKTSEPQERTQIVNQVYFSGTSKVGTHEIRDAIKERLMKQGVQVGDANLGVGNWSPEVDREIVWPAKQSARIEVITVEPDPNAEGQITGLGALEDITDAFFRLSLGAYDQEESGEHQYKFILLPDVKEHPELLTGEFKRAYNIIMQHYKEAQQMPGFGHHIKIFTSRDEMEEHLNAAVQKYFPQAA